jgi:hypothetical protein
MSKESEYYFRTKNNGTRIARFAVGSILLSCALSGLVLLLHWLGVIR